MPALLVEGRKRTREDATLQEAWRCPGALLRLAITAFDVLHWDRRLLAGAGRRRWAALLLGRIPLALTHQTIRDGHGIPPSSRAAGPMLAALTVTGLVRGRAGLRELLGRMGRWRVGLRW
jgi:hypothetical protein